MLSGRNAFTCSVCDRHVVTLDKDNGAIPMTIPCVASSGCSGAMYSHFYKGPVVNSSEKPTHEFRVPTREEYEVMTLPMREHIDAGGLEIYPIRMN